MASLSAKATAVPMGPLGPLKCLRSADATRARIAALQIRPRSCAPPKRLDRTVELSVRTVKGWPLYTVTPRGALSASAQSTATAAPGSLRSWRSTGS